jgi:hypothetical protein
MMKAPLAIYIGAHQANSVMGVNAAFHTSLQENSVKYHARGKLVLVSLTLDHQQY